MEKTALDQNWKLRRCGDGEYIPASVPGDLYSDLLAAGIIDDPYRRDNELRALPLSDLDYEYAADFDVPAEFIARERVMLIFEGIDTLADVYVNGRHLLYADNMHRTWEIDVKDAVCEGRNSLTVVFHSPTKYIRERYAAHRLEGTSDAMRGFPYIRKAHCMFGWDWGPRLPGCGIWRPVYLAAYDMARIRSAYITQRHENGKVMIDVKVELQSSDGRDFVYEKGLPLSVKITVTDPDGDIAAESDGTGPITIDHPRLWQPAGYGGQPLYTVTAAISCGGKTLDVWERRIGLRTMTVSRVRDEWGESFSHRVNGVDIFALGADYIPEDSMTARITPERTRRLLEDAKAANFNCIRVWGGGHYPSDAFYDICDELGLVVWQDFMFACAVYELDGDFEKNITAEFYDNIRRLRHHASLGLWCGNNEMEMFVAQGTWVTEPKQRSDYVKMYEYILPRVLADCDPNTFYWPASPSSGGAFDRPNDENRGDVHYWDVWHGGRPFTEYRQFYFRYLSEFGFQSFPSVKTIESFTEPCDRNAFSYVMEKHQRNDAANGKIASYMSSTYLYPTTLDAFVYASQLLQAQAIKYGVEHFRRNRGRCMGAVIWQLNDCWPVASWSSIDYYGRWKALHYYAKRFFAPLLLSCEEESILTQDTNPNAEPYEVRKSVRFCVTNDTAEPVTADVVWRLCGADGSVKLTRAETVTSPPLSAVWLEKVELPQAELYGDHVFYELSVDGASVSSGSVIFCRPKHYKFLDPHLRVYTDGGDIVVSADAYAKDVEIRNANDDLVLSDNFFDMEPGERRVRVLRGDASALTARSSRDIR